MGNQLDLNFLSPEEIGELLAGLPEERLLLLTYSYDQRRHWVEFQITYTLVAEVWIAYRENLDDPIRHLLESGEISKNDHERIWALADFFESLRVLVYWSEPLIREEFSKNNYEYPFKNRTELLADIVREYTSFEFSLCLSYRERPRRKEEKSYRYLANYCRGEALSEEQRRVIGMSPSDRKAARVFNKAFSDKLLYRVKASKIPLSLLLITVAHREATRNNRLNKAWANYWEAAATLLGLEATHRRTQGSYAWIDGHRVQASKDGTYQRPKS
jgi:hypothetical protein